MLFRDLDLRFAISCSSQNADSAAMTEIKKIAEELCLGMTLRLNGCMSFTCGILLHALLYVEAFEHSTVDIVSTTYLCQYI